jgi:hypothetical protein
MGGSFVVGLRSVLVVVIILLTSGFAIRGHHGIDHGNPPLTITDRGRAGADQYGAGPRLVRTRRRSRAVSAGSLRAMCRNITTLRGLEPSATPEEVEAAARQYVRKVSGVQKTSAATEDPFERAVRRIADVTAELLAELPERRQPPPTLPPLRRIAARSA